MELVVGLGDYLLGVIELVEVVDVGGIKVGL